MRLIYKALLLLLAGLCGLMMTTLNAPLRALTERLNTLGALWG